VARKGQRGSCSVKSLKGKKAGKRKGERIEPGVKGDRPAMASDQRGRRDEMAESTAIATERMARLGRLQLRVELEGNSSCLKDGRGAGQPGVFAPSCAHLTPLGCLRADEDAGGQIIHTDVGVGGEMTCCL